VSDLHATKDVSSAAEAERRIVEMEKERLGIADEDDNAAAELDEPA
jgi:hypothetical protein